MQFHNLDAENQLFTNICDRLLSDSLDLCQAVVEISMRICRFLKDSIGY